MKIRTFKGIIRDGFHNVFKNRVMSLASICAITAALFVLGLVLAAVINLNHIVSGLESRSEITIYIKDGTAQADILLLEQKISSWDGVYELDYISKEQALENWRKDLGEKAYLLDGYGNDNNPLPASFVIRVEKPELVEGIVRKAAGVNEAEKVQYSKDVVEAIGRIAGTTRIVGLIIVIVLILMAMVIISNTIKLSVYSRRREINIMKYIGATDWYIRWPFIIEGFALGFLGALAAGGITAGLYSLVTGRSAEVGMQQGFLSMFQLLPLGGIIWNILMVFVSVGGFVGLCAGMLSVHRHLEV